MKFDLQLGGLDDRLGLNSFDEGLEFAFRNLNGSREWIPLMFYSSSDPTDNRNTNIMVGDRVSDKLKVRGYNVSYMNTGTIRTTQLLKICGDEIAQNHRYFNWIQFRWLQTVKQEREPKRDRILLDNVQISAYLFQRQHVLFTDEFDNQTNIK